MDVPNISDETLRERISSYVHPASVPPITNSTRSLLKSKLTMYEEKREHSHPGSTSSSPTTPPITMSFKCAKNDKSEKSKKRAKQILREIATILDSDNQSDAAIPDCNITSSVIEDEEMQSFELEVVHGGIKETNNLASKERDDLSFQKAPIQTFVFFDIEATGLKTTTYKPRITELSFVAINYKDLLQIHSSLGSSDETQSSSSSFQNGAKFHCPRVTSKLTLCINPMKLIMPDVSDLTGLDNYNLECMKPFSIDTVKLINQFLTTLPQPACLVAHNGLRYDYPILKAEIQKIRHEYSTAMSECEALINMPCVDSLTALREICKEELNRSNNLMESENISAVPEELPEMPEINMANHNNEIQAHVEILEETQCPSVTSTPIKSTYKANYLLPITPQKEGDQVTFFHPMNKSLPNMSPSTPDCAKRPKVECNFDKEIVLTSRAPAHVLDSNHDIENIMSQAALELQEEAFITPDKPDQVNSATPPPPPRHSRGGKKRVVTHTNLSEVTKARKKLDFSTVQLSPEDKPPSFSLPKLHHYWFGSEPKQSHGAEADCLTLMKICAFKGQHFVNYANTNATTLSKINKMW